MKISAIKYYFTACNYTYIYIIVRVIEYIWKCGWIHSMWIFWIIILIIYANDLIVWESTMNCSYWSIRNQSVWYYPLVCINDLSIIYYNIVENSYFIFYGQGNHQKKNMFQFLLNNIRHKCQNAIVNVLVPHKPDLPKSCIKSSKLFSKIKMHFSAYSK